MDYDKALLEDSAEKPTEEPQEETIVEPKRETEVMPYTQNTDIVPAKDEFVESILENQQALERMAVVAEDVLSNSAEMANNVGKASDIESFATLLKNAAEVQEKIVALKEKRLKKPEVKQKEEPKVTTAIQNNIIIKSTRQLNDILKNIATAQAAEQTAAAPEKDK
jgi:hypothetical protein